MANLEAGGLKSLAVHLGHDGASSEAIKAAWADVENKKVEYSLPEYRREVHGRQGRFLRAAGQAVGDSVANEKACGFNEGWSILSTHEEAGDCENEDLEADEDEEEEVADARPTPYHSDGRVLP